MTFWSSMSSSSVGWQTARCVGADCCAAIVLIVLVVLIVLIVLIVNCVNCFCLLLLP
jgi:hypothetical protein